MPLLSDHRTRGAASTDLGTDRLDEEVLLLRSMERVVDVLDVELFVELVLWFSILVLGIGGLMVTRLRSRCRRLT